MITRNIYREKMKNPRMLSFTVNIKETDLWVAVDKEHYHHSLKQSLTDYIWQSRTRLEMFIKKNPEFRETLAPYVVASTGAPDIVINMVRAGNLMNVGPMAAVAGAFAELAGLYLLREAKEVIVENGGDIFLKVLQPCRIGIYAGNSPLSQKIALEIRPEDTPLGICTSSGSLGHSFSRGEADAVVITSPSTPLADAAATAICNSVKTPADIKNAVENASKINGISGALIIMKDQMAAWGKIKLCKS